MECSGSRRRKNIVKKYVSTIIFISIIVISVLMGVRQYKNDESLKSKENEPQTEVSWATPWGKATMKKVADLNETESYDTTKSFLNCPLCQGHFELV